MTTSNNDGLGSTSEVDTKLTEQTEKKVKTTKTATKAATKKSTKNPKFYLTNAELLAAVKRAKEKDELTDELARMFMKLVKRYASRINFVGYPYNDDLQSQALLNLTRGWKSFDETRFSNAFAYYTQITHNSFIQYLNHERSHRDIRDASLIDIGMMPSNTYLEALEAAEAIKRSDSEDSEDLTETTEQLEETEE